MRPIKTEQTNFTYHLPGGTEENDLPCVVNADDDPNPFVLSAWQVEPSDDLKPGDSIYVHLHGLASVEVGFSDDMLTERELVFAHGTYQTNVPLESEHVDYLLSNGGRFYLKVHQRPTPPISIEVRRD